MLDIDGLTEIVRDAARVEIVPRFRALDRADIASKSSDFDLVTAADIGAERQIMAALREIYPQALVVGEEAVSVDPAVMDGLAEAELAFVIDPVDGTLHFAHGSSIFGSMLAVLVRGEPVAGIILDAMLGDALVAEKGAGAWLRLHDGGVRRLAVAPPAPLDQMIGVMTWSYMHEPLRSRVGANLAKARIALSLGCSAHEYWTAASGEAHFTGQQFTNPWDHMPGVLIHQEAGGYSARFDGSPYRAGSIDGGILSAPDKDSWLMLRRDIIGD